MAEPCKEIHRDKELVWEYTFRGNVMAIVTDGSRSARLRDMGPEASFACHGRQVRAF